MTDIEIRKGNYQSALQLISEVDTAAIDNGTYPRDVYLRQKASIMAGMGDHRQAYQLALQSAEATDSLRGADAQLQLSELSAKLKAEINEEIHVGVGVNFGPAVVGNMGSERRMDYTAIGDTVNTSARLEANAPGGMVYVSRSVIDRLNGRMKYEPLEKPIKLKGKADGFEILRLLGPEE